MSPAGFQNTPGRTRSRTAGIVAIRTVDLTKVFGVHKAVNSVGLEIKTGEVFGFLGPNGAGKTTTINMILGLARPTSGHVEILGQRVGWTCAAARRHVGSLLDGVRFYPYLSARANLQVFAKALDGMPDRRVDEVLDLVGLLERARDKVRGYSHGMRRRLALALALLSDPVVLVLDEPASGLDPAGIKEMRDLMKSLASDGKAVFLSSHLLHEVEIICDKVAILRRGVVLAQGRVDELLSRTPAVELAVDRPDEAEKVLLAQPGVSGVRRDGERLVVEYLAHQAPIQPPSVSTEEASHPVAARMPDRVPVPDLSSDATAGAGAYRVTAGRLNAALAAQGIPAYEIRPHCAGLEDVFFEVLQEVNQNENSDGRAV
ncbi:MAG: ABC transporter ATP-binding protein [Bacillota bacterium]